MSKLAWGILGGVLAGVFVGAAAYEIMGRYYPDLIKKTQEKAKDLVQGGGSGLIKKTQEKAKGFAQGVGKAYKEGYMGEPATGDDDPDLQPAPNA